MMGQQTCDQSQLFYLFNLERRIPAGNLLRRINPVVIRILVELRDVLGALYSNIGRPSIDPELMIRMLIVGCCYGIRSWSCGVGEFTELTGSGSRSSHHPPPIQGRPHKATIWARGTGVHTDAWPPPPHGRRFSRGRPRRCPAGS